MANQSSHSQILEKIKEARSKVADEKLSDDVYAMRIILPPDIIEESILLDLIHLDFSATILTDRDGDKILTVFTKTTDTK